MQRMAALTIGITKRRTVGAFRLVAVTGALIAATMPSAAASTPAHNLLSQTPSPRLLYTGDWSGSREIYAVDPAHADRIAQITFDHDAGCDPLTDECGFSDVVPSPDGRHVAFESEGLCDYFSGPVGGGYLYVARADGRGLRQVTHLNGCATVAWAPDSRRLAYAVGPNSSGSSFGSPTIFVADADGSGNHRLTYGEDPAWSPDGWSLAFLDNKALWIDKRGHFANIASGVVDYAWSPRGRSLAIAAPYLAIIRPDGSHRRRIGASSPQKILWSADGRFIADEGSESGLETVDVQRRTTRFTGATGGAVAWSGRHDVLAFNGRSGLSLFDPLRGTIHLLTPDKAGAIAWAPEGRSLAYLDSDIRVVTTSGHARTIVSQGGTAGGYLGSIIWTRPPPSVRYRNVARRAPATVSGDELVAPWPVEHIAAEGSHVLYVSCNHLFVWTPASGEVIQAEQVASLAPHCTTPKSYLPYDVYDVALAGDRIAFGTRNGNMSQGWDLYQQRLDDPGRVQHLDSDFGYAGCTLGRAGLGDLVGAGSLLVFSRWDEPTPDSPATCGVATNQRIFRVDPSACPCDQLAASPGQLLPTDVDGGRVVAVGSNETDVLDATGKLLLPLPVHALAAQLSGADLVVLVQGALRDYDASSGALVHEWPLPDVPSGSPCGSPHPWGCPSVRLELEDAAHGLAAYVFDGQVHVVRLADGTDTTITKATMARFMDAGLVCADGAQLRLIPFASLPTGGSRR